MATEHLGDEHESAWSEMVAENQKRVRDNAAAAEEQAKKVRRDVKRQEAESVGMGHCHSTGIRVPSCIYCGEIQGGGPCTNAGGHDFSKRQSESAQEIRGPVLTPFSSYKGEAPTAAQSGSGILEGHFLANGKLVPGEEACLQAVRTLLLAIGEDINRDGLRDTPRRVVKALREMTAGRWEHPKEILSTVFEQDYDEIVILRNTPFSSLCEHHMLPYTGVADIGYLPGKVVGLSKLARLLDCFSKRLSIQEKLTVEIAESLMTYLSARGAAVVIKALHSCMACRGVKKSGATMVTSSMLGIFRDKHEARSEFLALCKD